MDELSNLIDRAQKGDKDAYGQIYKLFYKRIYRYCQFNINRIEIAQDICQETFLRAWKSLSNFSQRSGSFQAYLFKIAHNLIIDWSRKKKEVSLNKYEEPAPDVLHEDLEKQERVQKVKTALSKLDGQEQQIVILRYFEEMTTAEVAKVTGIREGATRVRIHRILKKLKGLIENVRN